MQVHGPHSEKFFKINSNAWLPLQGSPGVYFIILEIRVKKASALVHPAVPQCLRGCRFLPFSTLWCLACWLVLSYLPSGSPDSYRVSDITSHIQKWQCQKPCFRFASSTKGINPFSDACTVDHKIYPYTFHWTALGPTSTPKPFDATWNGTTQIASDWPRASSYGQSSEQVVQRGGQKWESPWVGSPMPKQHFTYFPSFIFHMISTE